MKDSVLIFEKNSRVLAKKTKNMLIKNGILEVTIKSSDLNNAFIVRFIEIINFIKTNYKNTMIPIRFVLDNVNLTDKLAYILLECIIESLIVNYNYKVELFFKLKKGISTAGIISSPLKYLGGEKNKNLINKDKLYIEKFSYDHYKNHFRRIIKYEDCYEGDALSKIYDEIAYFQKNFNINYDCYEEISEVIIELIGNAIEHTKSDCLVDFDMTSDYTTKQGRPVCGINISIISFSDTLLGDGLKNKITNLPNDLKNDRYDYVRKALQNHVNFFDDNYDATDFFNISAFQHKISGSISKINSGGVGLTKLIKSIEDKSEEHSCYVLTGDRIIMFDPVYLEYDKNGWIGFNENNDYLKNKPSKKTLQKSEFFMPGTAYNLNFIMKVN